MSNLRIVSLDPFLTELLVSFGLENSLVGISANCQAPEKIADIARVSEASVPSKFKLLSSHLSKQTIDPGSIAALKPEIIITSIDDEAPDFPGLTALRAELFALCGEGVKLLNFYPRSFNDILAMYERLGRDTGALAKGLDMSHRLKAQAMDWCDNFYERMKNKRVTMLSSVSPFKIAGWWLPDLIHLASAQSQARVGGKQDEEVTWAEIMEFRPDVILVAPRSMSLQDSMRTFKDLEKLPDWESVLAVKRGEVFFTDGAEHFYTPGSKLRESLSILISAIAGLDSGYISPRDSFYRLRWLEMQRHRL